MTKLRTESHQGRPIEFSIDENGRLGIEFDDYACSYRYMSEAKARELRDWLNHVLPDEPEAPPLRALIEHIENVGHVYSYEPIFERARDALNRQAESTAERCSICGSTAGPTSSHPHLPGYK